MGMQRYYGDVRDRGGQAVDGAQVTVTDPSSGALVVLYSAASSDDTPSATINNPITTDALGQYSFAVPNGDYDIAVSGNNVPNALKKRMNLWDGGTSAGGPMTNPMSALGDMIYGGSSGTPTAVSGNVTATKKYLSQTGNGSVSASPSWSQILASEVSYTRSGSGTVATTLDSYLTNGLVSIEQFGGSGNDSTDNTAALNAAATYCAVNSRAGIYFPPGSYRFLSKPNDFLSGLLLVGDGSATTYFKRHYTPGSATEGFLTWNPNGSYQAGGGVYDIGLLASASANGGALIKLIATATTRPGFMRFQGVKTGSNVAETINYNVYIDGSAFTTVGSNGIRDINLDDCWFFQATTRGIHIDNGVHIYINNCLLNVGGGSVADINITGGGGAGTQSQYVFMSNVECVNVSADNCADIKFSGYGGNLTIGAGVTGGNFVGTFGTVSNSSTSVNVIGHSTAKLVGPLTVAGATTLSGTLGVSGVATFSNATTNFGGSGVASTTLNINGTAGTQRSIFWASAGSTRWQLLVNNNAESGGDAGSPFQIAAYTDAAGFIDFPVNIARVSGGTVTLGGTTNRQVLCSSTTDSSSTITGALVASGGLGVAKKAFIGDKLNLASIAAPSTNGDIWQDSTQKAIGAYVDGIKQMVQGTIFAATTSATVANTTTETTVIGSGVGTKTLPANFFVAGKTIRITARGTLGDTGTPTLQIKLKYGSTVVLDSTAVTLATFSGSPQFEICAELTCRTTGASGTVQGGGHFQIQPSGAGSITDYWLPMNLATIDTTASSALDITATWGTANASNTITGAACLIEVLN